MFSHVSGGKRRLIAAVAAVAAVTLSGCSGGSTSQASAKDSVTYAWPVSQTPNWLLPIGTPGHTSTINSSVNSALWTPLVTYDTAGGSMSWDKKASLAKSIKFSADGLKATIKLNKVSWSDGKPVTTRDVEFWYNLVNANKSQWASYVSGRMPDMIKKFDSVDSSTFTLTFDKVYNQDWLKSNQLTLIRPIPQHAWDKTGKSAPTGNADRTPSGAKKVFKFLTSRSKDMGSYASDKLWQVTSGQYSLKSFTASGNVTLSKNAKYDGADPAHIKTVKLKPFTSADAEQNALRSKSLDYGYITASAMSQKSTFTQNGYAVTPKPGWSVTYMPFNFNNPKMGKVFSQLYARQAIQRSVDQKSISKVIWDDTAEPDYGPIPQGSDSPYLSDQQKNNPYPYDLGKAKKLLTSHGWKKGSDGVATCQTPGDGAHECGAGIAKGTKFEITVLSQSGSTETDNMMNEIRSSLSKVGIKMSLHSAPVNTVLAQAQRCKPSDASCKWQLSFFGTSGSWYFPAYPTGESIFGADGQSNFGQYSNPKADSLLRKAIHSNDPSAMKKYSALLAKDLPVVWMPNPVYQVAVTRSGLKGTAQDSDTIYPQRWHY